MSTMIVEIYEAFKKAGVDEELAKKAAEAISADQTATKSDINKIEKEIVEVKGEIKLVKWMITLVIIINIIPILKDVFN